MTAETWVVIAIVSFGLAAAALAAAVIMFFRLNIIGVFGIVSGKTQSRDIEKVWARERARYSSDVDLGFFRRRQAADAVAGGKDDDGSGELDTGSGSKRRSGELLQPDDALSAMQLNSGVGRNVGGAMGGSAPRMPVAAASGETSMLAEGTSMLADGTSMLSGGTSMLADGTAMLADGTSMLADGTAMLADERVVPVEMASQSQLTAQQAPIAHVLGGGLGEAALPGRAEAALPLQAEAQPEAAMPVQTLAQPEAALPLQADAWEYPPTQALDAASLAALHPAASSAPMPAPAPTAGDLHEADPDATSLLQQ